MGVEDIVNAPLSAHAFCGLRVEDTVPDYRALSAFISELSEKSAMHSCYLNAMHHSRTEVFRCNKVAGS
jgi:hypothetical protein